MKHRELYKLDNKGKIRVWWAESEGSKIRVVSGILDGSLVESGWKQMEPKNVGKTNATTPKEQALIEVDALYTKQLDKGYHEEKSSAGVKKFIEPMLANIYHWKFLKNEEYWFSQPKLDGVRCITNSEKMQSRRGKHIVSAPHILEDARKFFEKNPNIIFDGELYNHEYKDDFNEISSILLKTKPDKEALEYSKKLIQYHVYDLIIPDVIFEERMKILNSLELPSSFVKVRTDKVSSETEMNDLYAEYLSDQYEGQMARINGEYFNKRTNYLLKRKEYFDEEHLVLDIESGIGNWAGKAKSVKLLDRKTNIVFKAGVKGTFAENEQRLKDKEKYIGGEATVRFQMRTPDWVPRFGRVIQFYEGKRTL